MKYMRLQMVFFTCLMVAIGALAASDDASAIQRGTKNQSIALVKMAVAYLKVNGPEKTYAEITNHDGRFTRGDMYVFVHDIHGKCLAHGQHAKLVGMEMIDVLDADGKPYMRERMEMAKQQASFWQTYKFSDPLTKKIRPKETYCEHVPDGPVICSGYYKE